MVETMDKENSFHVIDRELIIDQDTGAKHQVEVFNPQFGAECVTVMFGNSFSITMSWQDAIALSHHLLSAGEAAENFERYAEEAKNASP